MESVTLETIHKDLEFLKKEMIQIKDNLNELRHSELEVRHGYLEKLNKIRKEKGTPFKDLDELREIIEK